MSRTMSSPPTSDTFISLPDRLPGGGPLRIHYRDRGGSGASLLLLHGLASGCRIWDMAAPHLARSFHVIALDSRGHGLSDRPGSYSFAEVVGDVVAVIAAFALDRPVIAGHSWGGNVALQLAIEHP